MLIVVLSWISFWVTMTIGEHVSVWDLSPVYSRTTEHAKIYWGRAVYEDQDSSTRNPLD